MKHCQNSFAAIVFTCVFVFFSKEVTAQQLIPKLELLSHWDGHTHTGIFGSPYNSLWGWIGSDGRQYAILGSLDSIYFFDVTNPTNIKICDARPGRAIQGSIISCPNREFKTYKNYCYAVADNTGCSLQVYDLKYLPDSVHKVYDADTLSSGAHSLFIDGSRLYLTWNKRIFDDEPGKPAQDQTSIPMTVVSLKNPEVPTFIADLHFPPLIGSDFYVHDGFARNDTVYCCCGPYGMYIYNYKDSINPTLLQAITDYTEAGYNHSCWLSPDGNLLVFTDETPGAMVKLYNVSALKTTPRQPDLRLLCLFGSNSGLGSIGHNAYMKGNLIYMSYYEDGVVVFDMSDSTNVHEVASYDTYPQNATGSYDGLIGCWNVYPFFPSGTIIASDMTNGLFVLKLDSVSAINSNYINSSLFDIRIMQNPFLDVINLSAKTSTTQNVTICLYDMVGKKMFSSVYGCAPGITSISIPCPSNLSGTVILSASTANSIFTRKLIKMGDE